MNKRVVWILTALAVLCFTACKDREEKAFKREAMEVAKSISEGKSPIIGTWIKEMSDVPAMPAAMEIKEDGKLVTYEDDGELGLDSEKGTHSSWKTEGDFFIFDHSRDTVKYYYKIEKKRITFFDAVTGNAAAAYTKKN